MTAVLYAFSNNLPIFFAQQQRPFRFDYLDPSMELSCLKLGALEAKSLTTIGDKKEVGIPKEIVWERLLFLLSLSGNAPAAGLCNTLRYDGSRLVCSNEYSKILEVSFDECCYFEDKKSFGFTHQKILADASYMCYDYIAFNKGGKHEIDYISTEDDFVSEIWFYPSDRIDGNTGVKDACVVSKLTHPQLEEFNYSETMAKFKMISEMESRGMKGLFNGYTTNGKPKHYKFQTTHILRRTIPLQRETTPAHSNIEIPQISEEGLLADLSHHLAPYDRFLKHL